MAAAFRRTPSPHGNDASGASFVRRRGLDLLANIGVLGALWFLYTAVRGVSADHFSTAMANAADLINFQAALGLPSELGVQQQVLDRTGLLRAANIYYVAIHFPVTIAFVGWVWLNHRHRFNRIRNTLVGVTAVGMLVHAVYPLAPPRMITGFVDTAAMLGPNPYDLNVSQAANQIAAMPSLHVGWALLLALGVIWIGKSRWRWLALIHPLLTSGVVVLTANHYWTDAIVAALLVGFAWLLTSPRAKYTLDFAGLFNADSPTDALRSTSPQSPPLSADFPRELARLR